MKIGVEEARTGGNTLFVERGGTRSYAYSRNDPREDGSRFFRARAGEARGSLIFIGLGLGHHIRPFLDAAPGGVVRVEILEPEEELYRAAAGTEEVRALLRDPRVRVHVGEGLEGFIARLEGRYDLLLGGSLRVFTYPPLKNLFEPPYAETERRVRSALDALAGDGMTIGRFARRWLRNFAANAGEIGNCRAVSSLYGGFAGAAVVTGAGPSLERSLDALGERRDRFTLVATDASVGPLVRRGVAPDFIVTIDPQPLVFSHFSGLPRRAIESIPAVISPLSCPEVFGLFKEKYLFFTLHPLSALFDADRLKMDGAMLNYKAVGSYALRAALLMGFSPVLLAGFDFSYPGLRAYARDTFFHGYGMERWDRLSPFPTIEASLIKTSVLSRVPRPGGGGEAERPQEGPPGEASPVTGRVLLECREELERVAREAVERNDATLFRVGTMGLPLRGVEPLGIPALGAALPGSARGDGGPAVGGGACGATGGGRGVGARGARGTGRGPGLPLRGTDPASDAALRDALALTLALRERIFRGAESGEKALEEARRALDERWLPRLAGKRARNLKFRGPGSDT